MSRTFQSSFVNVTMNCMSWSDMTFIRIPKCRNMYYAYKAAISSAPIGSLHGMKMVAFEQLWSTMVSTLLYSPAMGSLVIKSRPMTLNGNVLASVSIGRRGTFGFEVYGFVLWHMVHPFMYCLTSSRIVGHQ